MRLASLVFVAISLVGCQGFGQGLRDEGARQIAELAAEQVDERLGDDFKELGSALREIPAKIPEAPQPVRDTIAYSLGALVAYVIGSAGKGYLRSRRQKKA